MAGYQAVDKFIWYYKKVLSLDNTKLFIATVDCEAAGRVLSDIKSDRLIIKSLRYEQMNDLYCAADFALMFREPRLLNRVASPTKFGEYCLAGLPVIHNESVEQVCEYAEEIGNGISINTWPLNKMEDGFRNTVSILAKRLYGRDYLDKIYLSCYEVDEE